MADETPVNPDEGPGREPPPSSRASPEPGEPERSARPPGGDDVAPAAGAEAGGIDEGAEAGDVAEQALGQAQRAVDDLRQGAGAEQAPEGGEASQDAPPEAGGDAEEGGADEAGGSNVDLPAFRQVIADAEARGIDLLHDVDLDVKIELGRTRMFVEDVLRLDEGCVVELDKLAGDPVDVYVNERLVARGEVLVLNDNFCVRISEVLAEAEERDGATDRDRTD